MARRNLITDVAGLRVGNAHDARLASGVTAIVFDEPAVTAVDVRGGAPGTRETDLLEPHRTVERIDAVVLSGGSAFGLDAPTGVQAWLREQGRGFAIGDIRIPIVCGAVLFDMLNGGDKNWGASRPTAISVTPPLPPSIIRSRLVRRVPASARRPSSTRAGSARRPR